MASENGQRGRARARKVVDMNLAANLNPDTCYAAVTARDPRCDGVFFVCVTTTGIYCRPVCPARTPGRDRCVFVNTPAAAERAGFRACLRCRPDLERGAAPVDAVPRLADAASRRIRAGALDDGGTVEGLARDLGVSGRQLRRSLRARFGQSPGALARGWRLARARAMLADSALPITEVAFASGFRSLRRFNAAFRARFGCAPSQLRRARRAS